MTTMVVAHAISLAGPGVFMDGERIVEDGPENRFFRAPRSGRAHQFLSKILRR